MAALLGAPLVTRAGRAQAPLLVNQAIEMTGPWARAGDAWRNGVEMAVQELNAAGGLLGQPLQVTTFDVNAGRSAVQRALEGDPLALLGPVTTTAARMTAAMARNARLAVITGADAPELTVPGGHVFRAGPGLAVRMPRLASWMKDGLRLDRVSLVWSNDEFGRTGRDLLVREIKARAIEIVSEHAALPETGYSAEIAALARAPADAAVVYLADAECVRFLREAQRQALRLMLVGETSLAAPRVIEQAGTAANGVRCHVGFCSQAADVAAFSTRYAGLFKSDPDAAAAKGYTAIGLLAAGVARLGGLDRARLPSALHGLRVPAGAPAMIMESAWDAAGEMTRQTFLVEVRDTRAVVVGTAGGA